MKPIILSDGAQLRERDDFDGLWLYRGEDRIRDLTVHEEDFVRSAYAAGQTNQINK